MRFAAAPCRSSLPPRRCDPSLSSGQQSGYRVTHCTLLLVGSSSPSNAATFPSRWLRGRAAATIRWAVSTGRTHCGSCLLASQRPVGGLVAGIAVHDAATEAQVTALTLPRVQATAFSPKYAPPFPRPVGTCSVMLAQATAVVALHPG